MTQLTHGHLCQIARRWLLFSHSRGGHGCQVALVEPRIGFLSGEIPDAIGFRASNWLDGSVMVECKASRADFLADRKKPHREGAGMGRWRYYMAPEGVIGQDELPARWGLLVVNARSSVKAIAGAASVLPTHSGKNAWPDDVAAEMMAFELEHDAFRESLMLAKMLHRVGNPEAVNQRLREAEGNVQRLGKRLEKNRVETERLRKQLFALEAERDALACP